MRRFADGAFDTRTSEELARGDAEVANLARVFDGMADKIESSSQGAEGSFTT